MRTAWTSDVRLFKGYDPIDARPPIARVLELAREAASEYGRVGLELSLGTQAADRMVGEPTTFTRDWFTGFGEVADATPLLVRRRGRSRPSRRSSACASRTTSPPQRWSTAS